jgi:hypothetical protein
LDKGYQISVLTSRFDKQLPSEEEKENLHIYRVGKGRISFIFAALKKGIQIFRKNKEIAPISLIHTSTYG